VGSEVHAVPVAARVLGRLVASPSPQTGLFEADPAVQTYLRETVAGLARELGLRPEFDSMGNLLARIGHGRPRVVLFGYAMTHPGNRMRDPFEPIETVGADGSMRLRGRGAAEQKAATAALLLAASRLRQQEKELGGELVICVSSAGETGRHDAARTFLDTAGREFEWAIVALGTDNRIGLGNKGRLDVNVTVRGRSSHSSTPWAGVDAIAGARRLLDRLDRVELRGSHPELGSPTLTVTSFRSYPEATHTVQDEVHMTLDRRLLPGDDPEVALRDLRTAAAELAGWSIELEPGPFMYPSSLAPDAPLPRLLQDAATELGRGRLEHMWSHGAIDAGFFNREGIPAVMFGPGAPEMFHTDEESVAIEDVITAAGIYESVVRKQLTAGRST
jgi:acetylornithine deacetylase